MNELTFKDSKSMCYKIVTDSSGKKYLMDISTLTPKFFGFGFLPKRARVEMVEIDKKVTFLIRKPKKMKRYWYAQVYWDVHQFLQFR